MNQLVFLILNWLIPVSVNMTLPKATYQHLWSSLINISWFDMGLRGGLFLCRVQWIPVTRPGNLMKLFITPNHVHVPLSLSHLEHNHFLFLPPTSCLLVSNTTPCHSSFLNTRCAHKQHSTARLSNEDSGEAFLHVAPPSCYYLQSLFGH